MALLFKQVDKLRQNSQFKKAQMVYENWLHRASLKDEEKTEVLLGLADVERIQGEFTRSLRHYQKASDLYQKHFGDIFWDAQVGWALAARACGRPREGLAILLKALAYYQVEKDTIGEAFCHWALGGTYRILGNMRRGLQELQKALRMYQGLGHSEGTAYTCCALGGLFRMLGRYSQSEKFYREANRRMRLRKDVFGIAYSYCGLGNVERMSGRFLQALPFYRKAEKLYATIGDRVSYAYTLWSIATTYKMLGQYSPSWSAYQEADHLFRITGDTRGLIYSRLGFAEIEYLKGVQAKGNKYWQQALDLSSKSDFAWEKLHVAALKKGGKQNLYTSYRKAGSLFYPRQLPINWP